MPTNFVVGEVGKNINYVIKVCVQRCVVNEPASRIVVDSEFHTMMSLQHPLSL